VVTWFLDSMPRRYFEDTDADTRLSHLLAILAARAAGQTPKLVLKTDDEWTFIQDRDYPGLLRDLLQQIPHDRYLRSAKVHTTDANDLVLDVFRLDATPRRFDPADADMAAKRDAAIAFATAEDIETDPKFPLTGFIEQCSASYLATVTPLRIVRTWELCRGLAGTPDSHVALEPEAEGDTWRVSFATGVAASDDPGGNASRDLFERVVGRLSHHRLDIQRAYLDTFSSGGSDGEQHSVVLIAFVVRPVGSDELGPESSMWSTLRRDLLRIKWIDERVFAVAERMEGNDLARAELLVALAQLVHPALARENPYAFTLERIERHALRYIDTTTQLIDFFFEIFSPDHDAISSAEDRVHELLGRIERSVGHPDARRVLTQMLLVSQGTQYTNLFVDARYGLALRFDPSHMMMPQHDDAPHAAIFVHGRGFSAFHVRFRDIARGGVRVVVPSGSEQHALESERIYGEAYGLAFAQQLKNKDIPEGGAKAVILAEPGQPVTPCVKAFANSVLDLISPDPATAPRVRNRSELRERIYLGPDENISPAMIEWIVDRARRRSYPNPNAFMSSKPGAGINHKEYGVTSEGVTVFLEEALEAVGIDPRAETFTIKMTGGPDGDVAGNMIKICQREFGERARFVGIADGSGCAEDPDGLNLTELMRLVDASLPIAELDPACLGPRGRIDLVTAPEGARRRNTMHNRVVADAFVPAGGRPETMHEGNWRDYLVDEASSSKVIVEGANLFITPEARRQLASTTGAIIVKDSSANKTGVICSSYEIISSMLLSTDELLAVKERFVGEVVDLLRELARREAVLLFHERRHHPDELLPDLSIRLSKIINRATDAIEAVLDEDHELFGTLVLEHLPAILVEKGGDRVLDHVPAAYSRRIAACVLATKIIYREGIDYLARLDDATIGRLALDYLRQEQETTALIAEVEGSGLANRSRIAELLRTGGTRAGLSRS
jgi:glutamate dehydrogenase